MKKLFLIAAIAVAGVAAWAASNTNAFSCDDEADATEHEIVAYGQYLGSCYDGGNECVVQGYGGICYCFDGLSKGGGCIIYVGAPSSH